MAIRLRIEERSIAAKSSGVGEKSENSSGISAEVAPAAKPIPKARKPALRPIVVAKNHLLHVLASSRKTSTIRVPASSAVSYPKLG